MSVNTEENFLPPNQREGSPRSLGFAWAGVMLTPGAIITGMVAAGGASGPGFFYGFLGLAIGVLLGMAALGVISLWGPKTGLAAMPLARLAFGGAIFIPRIFLIFSLIAYNGLNDLFGVNALADSLGISFALAISCVLVIEITVVFLGLKAMRVLGLGISAVMIVISVWLIISIRDIPAAPIPEGNLGIPMAGIWLAIALGLSSSISWTVQATDLSRTLPEQTSRKPLFLWVFLGSAIPLLVLGGVGAWLSTNDAILNPMKRVESVLGGGLMSVIALVVMGAALATANGLNDFSGGLSLKQMGVRLPRPIASLIITGLGLCLAIIARNSSIGEVTQDVVLLAGYYTTPWFGIVIVELLYRRASIEFLPERANSAGPAIIAFSAGLLILLPFTATPIGNSLAAASPMLNWIGWFSRNLMGGAGAGYLVGVLAGATIYAILRRKLINDDSLKNVSQS